MIYCPKHNAYHDTRADCATFVAPASPALQIAALTAENERLRAEVERLKAHKPDVFGMVDALRLDLARVTEDAAARCSDLRAKLDALRAAGQAVIAKHDRGWRLVLADLPESSRARLSGIENPEYDALRAALAASEEE